MIITLTPNPSTDATVALAAELERGQVLRARSVDHVAGGKGVNVAHAAALAGADTLAVFPAGEADTFLALVAASEIPYRNVPIDGAVRTNTTVTEPDGTTTKLNGPGPRLQADELDALAIALVDAIPADEPTWVALSGSLPPGVPTDWYATLVRTLRARRPHALIAVDTSDAPMVALGERFPGAAPDLIKPNGLELGQLVGHDGNALEEQAAAGDFAPVVAAAREVVDRGVGHVLVTLGGAGAVLATESGYWRATTPPVTIASTVGAGDSSLAGFMLAHAHGESPAECLRRAVAYGSAAASLPGTELPHPEQADLDHTQVYAVD